MDTISPGHRHLKKFSLTPEKLDKWAEEHPEYMDPTFDPFESYRPRDPAVDARLQALQKISERKNAFYDAMKRAGIGPDRDTEDVLANLTNSYLHKDVVTAANKTLDHYEKKLSAHLRGPSAPLLPPDTPGPSAPPPIVYEYEAPPGGNIKSVGEALRQFEMPDYLWDGILQKRFCYSLTAQTGSGKTALAMLIAAHVATGRSLAGLDVERGPVLYLAAENPLDVQMRWLGLTKTMGIDPDAFDVHTIEGVIPLSKAADHIKAECVQKGLQPSLIVVDTSAAFYEGADDNSNTEQGEHARRLRSFTTLPGAPCVLVLCHPTKGAKDINEMIPRGGGAFLNEVDGNLGMARVDGGPIAVQAVGKFRGPEFAPLRFALHSVRDHPRLIDRKGKQRSTVICQPVSEAGAAAWTAENENADIRLMRDIDSHPGDPMRDRGKRLGCDASTVKRRIDRLETRRLVDNSGLTVRLTAKGQKELNALESVQQGATNVVPFPPLPGP